MPTVVGDPVAMADLIIVQADVQVIYILVVPIVNQVVIVDADEIIVEADVQYVSVLVVVI